MEGTKKAVVGSLIAAEEAGIGTEIAISVFETETKAEAGPVEKEAEDARTEAIETVVEEIETVDLEVATRIRTADQGKRRGK